MDAEAGTVQGGIAMDRLTKMINGRPHGAEGVSAEKLTGKYFRGEFEATAIVERLSFYEALEEACMEREGMDLIGAVSRLGHYSTLVEAGWLVELPCKIGDTVWYIRPLEYKKEIIETVVVSIVVKKTGLYMKLACNKMYETSCKSIGKSVFLTREEAEAALKGETP